MAESMFRVERAKETKKTWRAVVIGAAVPIAMLASAPAVSAAEIDQIEARTVQSEQLDPPVEPPAGAPDPAALFDLEACLTELQGLIAQLPPPSEAPAEAEQLPDPGAGDPVPDGPDAGALTETCKQVVEIVKSLLPPAEPPVGVPPIEPPVEPPVQTPVEPPVEPPVADPLPVPAP